MSKFSRKRQANGIPDIAEDQQIILDLKYFQEHAHFVKEVYDAWSCKASGWDQRRNQPGASALKIDLADAINNYGLTKPFAEKITHASNSGEVSLNDGVWIMAANYFNEGICYLLAYDKFEDAVVAGTSADIRFLVETKTGKVLRL